MSMNTNKPVSEVINNFMKMTKCKKAVLYGGAAIDRFLNPSAKIMDYDIAIKDLKDYQDVIEELRNHDFDVAAPRISHNLSTVAKHKDFGIFDLSCMDIKQNGIYNLEKFYIEYSAEYPRGKAVDPYGAVAGLREGRIEIINNPDKEKAYDLLRRFTVLAGKYGFSLDRNGINKKTMDIIEHKLQKTPILANNAHDRVRCLSRFLGAPFRAKSQADYLENIGKTNLMSYGFPQINTILNNPKFIEQIRNTPATNKHELIEVMLNNSADRDAFIDEISLLKKREREREDPNVFKRIDAFDNEKTSVNRLQKSIINPLLLLAKRRENSKG